MARFDEGTTHRFRTASTTKPIAADYFAFSRMTRNRGRQGRE
jgi:hypothetical protein